jgi:hypothetical protein
VVFVWRAAPAQEGVLDYALQWALAPESTSTYPTTISGITDTSVVYRQWWGYNTRSRWRVRARNDSGWGPYSEPAWFDLRERSTLVTPKTLRFSMTSVSGCHGVIRYSLAQPARVSVDVYNLLGCRVLSLVNRVQPAGVYTVTTAVGELGPGQYLLAFRAGAFEKRQSISIVR